jgi:signal transduction histidine kinase
VVLRDLREVASLRARLVTSGRLAAVGQLAAGLAHEINNPVAYVSSNLRQLLGIWSDVAKEGRAGALPEAMREELDEGLGLITESLDGVARVAAIVSGVRAFSHAGTGTSEPTDVNEAVRSALRIAGPQIPPGATVETVLADLPPVRGNAQQLQQVFLNLVVNAVQAIGPQGSVRLVTGRDGADVHVRVEDDGCGMAADVQERIFDPFFTTKPVGQGTGLGLSISYQIVRDHGGDLSVESAPGRGACFRVRLPAA